MNYNQMVDCYRVDLVETQAGSPDRPLTRVYFKWLTDADIYVERVNTGCYPGSIVRAQDPVATKIPYDEMWRIRNSLTD